MLKKRPQLTTEQRTDIKRAYASGGVSQGILARRYGVSQGLIYRIVHNITGRHGKRSTTHENQD